MKKVFATFCLTATLALAAPGVAEKSTHDIDRFMSAWHLAAAQADAVTYFDSLAAGAIFLGTDIRERWTKEEFQKWAAPYFKRPSAWTFRASRRQVTLSATATLPGSMKTWFPSPIGPAAVLASWKRSPENGGSASTTWLSVFPMKRPRPSNRWWKRH